MKTIKLEIPNDDAIALRYMGEALVNMAGQYGTKKLNDDLKEAVVKAEQVVEGSAMSTVIPKSSELTSGVDEQPVMTPTNLDREPNLPWDERIHSGNKTQNVDGSWKKRKKPKDMTTEQWNEFIEQVETELTTLMSIPVETSTESENTPEPPPVNHDSIVSADPAIGVVTIPKPSADAKDVETQQADVTVSQPDIAPSPPVEIVPKPQDAVTPPPPPVVNDAPVGTTQEGVKAVKFVELVKMLSVRCAGDVTKSTKIKEAIKAKYDVEFTALSKRPDLIPQVAEFLNTIEV